MSDPTPAGAARAADLDGARYVSLETFRRSGVGVATPVWFAEAEGRLYVFTAGDAGKVKRLRSSPRARVAVCDVRGRRRGPWIDARARVETDPARVERAYAALRGKYGWQMALTDLASRLTGRYAHRAVLEIRLTDSEKDPGEARREPWPSPAST